jgi:L,D-transpeptidase ErfK/SrfK
MRVTHGCLRLYPEDIAALYELVPVGAPVTIVDQPVKAGWRGDTLYMEAHPPSGEKEPTAGERADALVAAIEAARAGRQALVDWPLAEEALQRADGIPVAVGFAPPSGGGE